MNKEEKENLNQVSIILGIVSSIIAIAIFFQIENIKDLRNIFSDTGIGHEIRHQEKNSKNSDLIEIEKREAFTLNNSSFTEVIDSKKSLKNFLMPFRGKEIYFEGIVMSTRAFTTYSIRSISLEFINPSFKLVNGEYFTPDDFEFMPLSCELEGQHKLQINESHFITIKGILVDDIRYPYFKIVKGQIVEDISTLRLRSNAER